ncbi:cell division ATPase MinD [archaeon]|nr:cell division ATPase MinD [archaeon]
MTHYIGILSGKGGVGKTSTAVNLSAAMCHFGRDVILMDGNLSTPNIGLHLGAPVVPINLHHVLKGKNHITEAMYLHPSGIKIIPAGLSINDLKDVQPEKLKQVLPSLDGLTDVVIIDGAAGLGGEAIALMNAVKDLIIVTNPELPAVADAMKTIKIAEELGKNVRGVVVTKTGEQGDIPLSNLQTLLEKPILAIIPHDKAIRHSLLKKDPVIRTHPKSKSAIAYKKLAAGLIGIEYNEKAQSKFSEFLRDLRFR